MPTGAKERALPQAGVFLFGRHTVASVPEEDWARYAGWSRIVAG